MLANVKHAGPKITYFIEIKSSEPTIFNMKAQQTIPDKIAKLNGSDHTHKMVSVELEALDAAQVMAIDRAVRQVGEFGEIHLIVKRGQLRFIGTLKTEALMPDL